MKLIFLILFAVCFFESIIEAKKFTLYQKKPGPFPFEGEVDLGEALRTMLRLKNADHEVIYLSGSAYKQKVEESLF